MGTIDISQFDCSFCGDPIPDKELEQLVKVRLEAGRLKIICPKCLKQEEVTKRRQSLVIYTA